MASGISAFLGGMLGLGNQVTTNSSACTTGTEAIILGFDRIQSGKATHMLVGSCSDGGPYIWGGFDAMRVMTYNIMITKTMFKTHERICQWICSRQWCRRIGFRIIGKCFRAKRALPSMLKF